MTRGALRYIRRNPSLTVGITLLAVLALFVIIGNLLVDTEDARPLSVPTLRPPSWEYPFGTDRQGRDLLAVMVAGTPLTLRIGFIAGFLGVGIGTVLGFIGAFYRGLIDTIIRGIADIGLTVPGLLVLIIIAVSIKGTLTVNQMAIVVASLAWLYPTRTIRAQVLSLRERGYVEVARLSGMSGPSIIFFELMPNLLPYLAATLVSSVSAAILASIGLEVLGLGPIDAPTLGMTLYWVNFNAAMINGWWWWWTAPTVIILTVFLGLFFVTVGLDEIANPRLRRSRVSEPVLRVEGLARRFRPPAGPGAGGGRCQLRALAGRAVRAGRRVRLGEVDLGVVDPALDQAAWPDRGGRGVVVGHPARGPRRGWDACVAPRRHRAGTAGLDELAQPGAAHRGADRRCLRRAWAASNSRRGGTAHRCVAGGGRLCLRVWRGCIRTSCPAA